MKTSLEAPPKTWLAQKAMNHPSLFAKEKRSYGSRKTIQGHFKALDAPHQAKRTPRFLGFILCLCLLLHGPTSWFSSSESQNRVWEKIEIIAKPAQNLALQPAESQQTKVNLDYDFASGSLVYCNGDPVNGLDPDGRCVELGTSGASSGWGHGNGGFSGEYDSSNAKNQFAYNIGWSGGELIGDINAITKPIDQFAAGVAGLALYGLNTAIESTENFLGGPGAGGAIGFMAPLMALEMEAAASTTAAIEETGVVSKIPLPLPTSSGYNPWAGPIDSLVTKNDTIMYRTWGGGAGKVGAWLSPVKPTSTLSSIRNFALPIENSAEFFSKVLVPAGTRYQIGKSASAFGQPGGDIQVLLLDRISPANFGPTIPLAPWL